MTSRDERRRVGHRRAIEWTADMPAVLALEGAQNVGVPHPIAIDLPGGTEPRVKRIGRRFGRHDAHGAREPRVQRTNQCLVFNGAHKRKTRHLAKRVDASVGPSRTDDRHVTPIQVAKRVLEEALN